MSAATAVMTIGLVITLVGVALVVRSRARVGSVATALTSGAPVDGFDDVLERAHSAFRSSDTALRTGVLVAIAGLVLAVVGAYLGSDARALGADVGGAGTSDKARVGGTW